MLSWVKNTYRRWDSFWFGSVSPYPVSAFRVLFGLFILFYFLQFLPHISLSFSNEGIYIPFLVGDVAPGPGRAGLIYFYTIGLNIAFILGYRTRVVTPIFLLMFLYHYLLNMAVKHCSYDIIMLTLLLILCFGDLDKVWSVRPSRPAGQDTAGTRILAWAPRLIMVYIALIYFGMAVYKMSDPRWWESGLMLQRNLQNYWATPLAFKISRLDLPLWFFTALSWLTIALELFCSFAFFIRPIRRYAFWGGFIFHFLVMILLGLPEFMFMPLTYVVFMDADKVRARGDEYLEFLRKSLKWLQKKNTA